MREISGVRDEAIHPSLDECAREQFDAPELFQVYADWLEERGDPRGELIRMQLLAERFEQRQPLGENAWLVTHSDHHFLAEQIIRERWSEWFGALPRNSVKLTWEHGFVRLLEVLENCPLQSLAPLLSLPAMRFVRFVQAEHGFHGDAGGLPAASSLDCLHWSFSRTNALSPLAHAELPALTKMFVTFEVRPAKADLEALATLRAPALEKFQLTLGPKLDDAAAAAVLHFARERLSPLGKALVLRGPAKVFTAHRAALRVALPLAKLTPLDRDRAINGPWPTEQPSYAPPDFHLLRRWTKHRDGKAGPGERFSGQYVLFHFCAHCAGSNTRRIFKSREEDRSEYVCVECGGFSHYSTTASR
ncbi:MAG: TIGR02996 domain-containing protein [Myxococcaceae bacterium]